MQQSLKGSRGGCWSGINENRKLRLALRKSMDILDESKRKENERKFGKWEELLDGGRRYSYEIRGRYNWIARYVKEVNSMEKTLRFYQEIYNSNGILIEIHHKYPDDTGHKKIRDESYDNHS